MLDLASEPTGQCGTGPGRRDCEGDVAAADDGGGDEVAIVGIVDDVDDEAKVASFDADLSVELHVVGSGDEQVYAVHVRGLELAVEILDLTLVYAAAESRGDGGTYQGNLAPSLQETFDLSLGDLATADYEAGSALDAEKCGIVNWHKAI